MIRHPVCQIEATKPAVCEVKMNLFAEPSFRTDAEAISDQYEVVQM